MTEAGQALQSSGPWATASRAIARRPALALAPILFLFAAIAVGASPESTPTGDEKSYLTFAENLTHGQYSTTPESPNLWFGPGLPALVSPLVALDVPLEVTRLVGPLFLFLAALVFYRLAGLFVSRRAALLATWAFALYVPFYAVLPKLQSEPLAILFLLTGMYFSTLWMRKRGAPNLLFAALAFGCAAMTRVVFGWILLLILVLALAWWLAARRSPLPARFAAVLALALVACLPWLTYTYLQSDKVFYWSTSGGSSLYWMSSPYDGDDGNWESPADVASDPDLARHRPFFAELDGLSSIERDERFQEKALENIRQHPLEYAENVVANMSRMWFSWPFSYTSPSFSTLYYALPNALLLMLTAAALAVLLRNRRELPGELRAFLLLAGTAFLAQALLAAYTRMLMPIVPTLILAITFALTRCVRVERRGEGRWRVRLAPKPARTE